MEEVGGCEVFDALSAVEVHAAIATHGHTEGPPTRSEWDAADFLSEVISADEEPGFVFWEATIVGAVEFDEEAGPVVFLFFDVFGEEEDFFFFGDGCFEVDTVAEVAAGAVFPLVEWWQPDAGDAAGSARCGDHTDAGGTGHDQVILLHLHGVKVWNAGIECLNFECAAAAWEPAGWCINADDVVWLSSFGAFEPAAICGEPHGWSGLFVLFTTGFGAVMDPFPVGIFEVVTDLGKFFSCPGDDLGLGWQWE